MAREISSSRPSIATPEPPERVKASRAKSAMPQPMNGRAASLASGPPMRAARASV